LGEITRQKILALRKNLLKFHSIRDFPWRRTKDPYKVLISEILLQKTTSKQVEKIFRQFFEKFPSLARLALADIEEIRGVIGTLGLAKRAAYLKELASDIMNRFNGKVPDDPESLKSLKGVGKYTCNAVLCFAFNKPVPIVDTNIARVLRRYFGIFEEKPAYSDKTLWGVAQLVLPARGYRRFNYALLDLAAVLCLPSDPLCDRCPLHLFCEFASNQNIMGKSNADNKTPIVIPKPPKG